MILGKSTPETWINTTTIIWFLIIYIGIALSGENPTMMSTMLSFLLGFIVGFFPTFIKHWRELQ